MRSVVSLETTGSLYSSLRKCVSNTWVWITRVCSSNFPIKMASLVGHSNICTSAFSWGNNYTWYVAEALYAYFHFAAHNVKKMWTQKLRFNKVNNNKVNNNKVI